MCVRIDSYESAEHQKYVRTFLNGRFENSAFCLLSPDGQDWLSRAGRGPEHVLGRSTAACVAQLERVAAVYPAKEKTTRANVQDFHSVRQALNVASADQRVLVLVHGSDEQTQPLRSSLKEVANDPTIIGRFHIDFDSSADWKKKIEGLKDEPSIVLVRPGEFGLEGKVMAQLPLTAENAAIKTAMLTANGEFAKTTEKKVYSEHVTKGRNLNIYFEADVPYGEDRDGDGEIDRGGPGGGRSGRSGSGRSREGRRR
ncbi:MAG TPA: hypothetical protein DCG12_07970 [Planctomycetaceae bacterium]|nr:hypothetical protein [Planctomycetaceae bacterium]